MSQGSLVLPTTGTLPGLTLVQDLNTALDALATNAAGGSAPANTQAGAPETGQLWTDTSTTPPTLRLYNGSGWIPLSGQSLFLAQQATTPAMSVVVGAGAIFTGASLATVAAQTVTIATAPSSPNSRIDRICLNRFTGAYTYVQGTAASVASAPAIPSGCAPCCQVYVGSGVTTITNANITDERFLPALGRGLIGEYQNINVDSYGQIYPATHDTVNFGTSIYRFAQMAAVSGIFNTLQGGSYSGFVNKFRNAALDIQQRGTSGTIAAGTPAYTADGWIVSATGANVTWTLGAAAVSLPQGGKLRNAIKITGASSVTATSLYQRIEGEVAAPLAGQTLTFQAVITNNTGAALTPTLTTSYPTAADNWTSSTTDLASVSLQSIANGTTAVVAYTFTASSSANNGYAATLGFGSALNSGSNSVTVTALDLRATPGIATGLNSNPPYPELRPVSTETPINQRYLFSTYDNGVAPATATLAGSLGLNVQATNSFSSFQAVLPVTMRADPTVRIYSPGTGTSGKIYDSTTAADVAGAVQNFGQKNGSIYVSGVSTAAANYLTVHFFASAEL